MFRKILIANRGEIACRVIATCRRLGIATVAVYSDADQNAQHVRQANEAVCIGPAAASASYLCIDAIVQAAKYSGAEAIHPGYGFLSEHPDFVDAVTAAGLVFIGPTAMAIRQMGHKDAAKTLMQQAGVPVVPGYHGERQDVDFLRQQAASIGYPILIKARAGGGGKGMRRVDRAEDFAAALAGAQREAEASFSDPVCLIEKYIDTPRHIEVQVFGDQYGHIVHLFERDCSLQRRHQKVIEEAPAPGITAAVRQAICQAAVQAAAAVDYIGAGTVEFIADGSDGLHEQGFWFMEMNTRLQVEHPVSEAITGVDLVEWQLRVAAGEALPLSQSEIALQGHAVEARIYAEDAGKGFLPATGQITALYTPAHQAFCHSDTLRIDSGVVAGDSITAYYDPMIAKLIAYGPDRETALQRLYTGLRQYQVSGCITNSTFLARLGQQPDFLAGRFDTGLIAREQATLVAEPEPLALHFAVAAVLLSTQAKTENSPWAQQDAWRAWEGRGQLRRTLRYQACLHDIVLWQGQGRYTLEDGSLSFAVQQHGRQLQLQVQLNEQQGAQQYRWWCNQDDTQVTITDANGRFTFHAVNTLDIYTNNEQANDQNSITAPMPGLVKQLSVQVGDSVQSGQVLLVLEAMKMEYSLTAPRDGVIAAISIATGQQTDNGAVLVTLREEGEGDG